MTPEQLAVGGVDGDQDPRIAAVRGADDPVEPDAVPRSFRDDPAHGPTSDAKRIFIGAAEGTGELTFEGIQYNADLDLNRTAIDNP